jgi:hypothetical protein
MCENLGNVRVIHQGQRLPLRLEAGDDLSGVHAGLDDLQGHLAPDRLLLLGKEDNPEAALADPLQQLVRPDHGAGSLADRRLIGGGDRVGVSAFSKLAVPGGADLPVGL